MAKGGRRQGAGRPKGSPDRVSVSTYFTEDERKAFFEDLKTRAKQSDKIAIYLAEQMTGKATQQIDGSLTGELRIAFDKTFNVPSDSTPKATDDSQV